MIDILKLAREQTAKIQEDRRNLHRTPETGTNLPKTAAYICTRLQEMGIAYQQMEGYSAVVAMVGRPGTKTIGIRADMDALPICEESQEPFAAENGNMHACGHDAHMAILLGAAAIFKAMEKELSGQIKLIFQTSEEVEPSGARLLVRDGVMEQPHVDAMLVLHVDVGAMHAYPPGHVIFKYGSFFAWEDPFSIKITGKGGHGSAPHVCVDPIAAANLIYTALQLVWTRELDPTKAAVFSFGTVCTGNGTGNVIPDTALMKGTIRTMDRQLRDLALQRFRQVAEGIADLLGAKAEFCAMEGCQAVINDDGMVGLAIAAAKKLFAESEIHIVQQVALEAEDAGWYFEKAPGCYFRLRAGKPFTDGIVYPAHNSKFRLDDAVLYRGTAMFVQTAYDFLRRSR